MIENLRIFLHRSMDRLFGTNSGPYEAGDSNRTTRRWDKRRVIENDVPRENVWSTRGRAWLQFRNNPQTRKLLRSLQSKVIGRSFAPQSLAMTSSGEPHKDFRNRVKQLFSEIDLQLDFRGPPGRGGESLIGLHKTAFAAAVLSGGFLYRIRRLTAREQRAKGLVLPLQVQLLHVDRLDHSKNDEKRFFYGIELDEDGRRAAYHVLKRVAASPSMGQVGGDAVRIPVTFSNSERLQMGHLFLADDIDQLDGVPWTVAGMTRSALRNSYEIAEAEAADAAACIVMSYRPDGNRSLALPNPNASAGSLTDPAGNPITHFMRKMLVNLGANGELNSFVPNRPNAAFAEFVRHLTGSEAVGVPGVKTTTLHGDYRGSSFSSERSADNDVWPELEQLQEWFCKGFSHPLYQEILTEAVESGYFDGVPDFRVSDFATRPSQFTGVRFQWPVPRSINPKDDANASRLRIKNGQSSPQIEAAAIGHTLTDILDDVEQLIADAQARGLPDDIWMQMLGMEQQDTGPEEEASQSGAAASA